MAEFRARPTKLRSALANALRMRACPGEFHLPGYQSADGGWEWWLASIERGLGGFHGHSWNSMVWRERRVMASGFFAEIEAATKNERAAGLWRLLSRLYRKCSVQLGIATGRPADRTVQRAALQECRRSESRCAVLMEELRAEIGR